MLLLVFLFPYQQVRKFLFHWPYLPGTLTLSSGLRVGTTSSLY